MGSLLSSMDVPCDRKLQWAYLGAGGIRDLTLDANKLEQMLKYRKASFPKRVSNTFVAHCSLIIYESLVRFQSIVRSIKF